MARGLAGFGLLATALMLAAGARGGQPADARIAPVSTAMLAPPPESSLAFCRAHGGHCDPVPPAAAMPEGKPTLPPTAWQDFCNRNRADPACAR